MTKDQFLRFWKRIRPGQKLRPRPVAYLHEGSTYGEDGIRITGSRRFIASVLSRLKGLLAFENDETRLQVACDRSVDRESRRTLKSFNCYVQVHARGGSPKSRLRRPPRKARR